MYGDSEERFVYFATSCLYLIGARRLFRAGVNWGIAAKFAGDLADYSKSGGVKFQRAWVLLKALEACLET